MKKLIAGVSIIISAGLGFMAGHGKDVHCEWCGEKFNNKDTVLENMCDICFGWESHIGSITQGGKLVEFKDGTGYYFEEWK